MSIVTVWNIPVVGKIIRKLVVKYEGGERLSSSLRNYTKQKYGVEVGLHSYGGVFSKDFNTGGNVSVGRYCSIASGVHYLAGNHPINKISTSPYFYQKSWANRHVTDIVHTDLSIGNDCWIGYGVIITPGCSKIGNGSIIGAGSVVTKDVEAYAIVAGNPAKIIRYRFSELERKKIDESKWWEKEPQDLLDYYDEISNITKFLDSINGEYKYR